MFYNKLDSESLKSKNRKRATLFLIYLIAALLIWIGFSYENSKSHPFIGENFESFAKYAPESKVYITGKGIATSYIVYAKSNPWYLVPFTPELYVFNCYGELVDTAEGSDIIGRCNQAEKIPYFDPKSAPTASTHTVLEAIKLRNSSNK